MELEVARSIAAPQQRVWDAITDLDGAVDMLSAVQSVERLDEGTGFQVGTRWRETRTMFGRQDTQELVVTAVDAPRSYTVASVSGSTTYTSVFEVEAVDADRCELRMRFGATTTGVGQRLLAATIGRAFLGATRRSLEHELEDIARQVEGSA